MYVELLSAVVAEGKARPSTGDALLDAAIGCREQLLGYRPQATSSAQSGLAFEVAYDRALLNLCSANGIAVDPRNFIHPREERSRLEAVLAERGVDLSLNAPINGPAVRRK